VSFVIRLHLLELYFTFVVAEIFNFDWIALDLFAKRKVIQSKFICNGNWHWQLKV